MINVPASPPEKKPPGMLKKILSLAALIILFNVFSVVLIGIPYAPFIVPVITVLLVAAFILDELKVFSKKEKP